MLCLTIEWDNEEWFIDHEKEEMRLVRNPVQVKKFTEFTELELIDLLEALDYRNDEVTKLIDTFTELQYAYENQRYEQPLKAQGLWGNREGGSTHKHKESV